MSSATYIPESSPEFPGHHYRFNTATGAVECWQAYCGEWRAAVTLTPESIRAMAHGLPSEGHSDPDHPLPGADEDGTSPTAGPCPSWCERCTDLSGDGELMFHERQRTVDSWTIQAGLEGDRPLVWAGSDNRDQVMTPDQALRVADAMRDAALLVLGLVPTTPIP